MEPNGILIYGELNEDLNVHNVVLELLTKARELKTKIWNQRIMVCIIGKRTNYEPIIQTLGEHGANEVVLIQNIKILIIKIINISLLISLLFIYHHL